LITRINFVLDFCTVLTDAHGSHSPGAGTTALQAIT
jgi:hypothetical protein